MGDVWAKIKRETNIVTKLEISASKTSGVYLWDSNENHEYHFRKIFEKYPTLIKFMKSTDFGTNNFGGKSLAALLALKYSKSDIFNSLVLQIKEEKEIEKQKQIENEARRAKEMKDFRDAQINAVKQYLPGIDLLHDTATIHMNSSPWSPLNPQLNTDGFLGITCCKDGVYVVKNNMTVFSGPYHSHTYYCNLTVFEKKNDKFNILLGHSFYSGIYNVSYGKIDGFRECIIGTEGDTVHIIPFNIFMENNYTILKEFIEKNKKLLTETRKQELIRSDN